MNTKKNEVLTVEFASNGNVSYAAIQDALLNKGLEVVSVFVKEKEDEILPFNAYVKQFIADHLPDLKGRSVYKDDLAGHLCEAILADGSITCSTYEATRYIKEWWYECGDFIEYATHALGMELGTNAFSNPEGFMVDMVYEGVTSIIGRIDYEKEKITLTPAKIKWILSEVENYDVQF